MAILDKEKKGRLQNFRYVQRVAMGLLASYGKAWISYILFIDQRYKCCTMKNENIETS